MSLLMPVAAMAATYIAPKPQTALPSVARLGRKYTERTYARRPCRRMRRRRCSRSRE
jgi:hypothetical protein